VAFAYAVRTFHAFKRRGLVFGKDLLESFMILHSPGAFHPLAEGYN
jgi:hypothetical protein